MANYTVLVKKTVASKFIPSYVRTAKVVATDTQNGVVGTLASSTTVGDEVFTFTPNGTLSTGVLEGKVLYAGAKDPIYIGSQYVGEEAYDAYTFEITVATGALWMVVAPEVNKTIVGDIYAGVDPRTFINKKNVPFDVINLKVGDVIQVSKEGFSTVPDSGKLVVKVDTSGKFVASAS